MLIISNMGDHVWLITSKHTDPDLVARLSMPSLLLFFISLLLLPLDASGNSQLVNVGVEDAVHEADARGLVGVRVGQLDVDFPVASLERSCWSFR